MFQPLIPILDAISKLIGKNTDSYSAESVHGKLGKYNDGYTTESVHGKLGRYNDATGNSIFAKLSLLNSRSFVNSVQRGRRTGTLDSRETFESVTVSCSSVNPNKSIVLLNGHWWYPGTDMYGFAPGYPIQLVSMSANNFVVDIGTNTYSSYPRRYAFSWQIIEFN